jgi:hypothetical protein
MGKAGCGGCITFDSLGMRAPSSVAMVSEPPGFQLRMRSTVHPAPITCLAFSGSHRLLAAGDAAGGVGGAASTVPGVPQGACGPGRSRLPSASTVRQGCKRRAPPCLACRCPCWT